MVVALLAFSECHVWQLRCRAMLAASSGTKRLGWNDFWPPENDSRKSVDFSDLFVGHRITPARGAVTVDHEKAPVRSFARSYSFGTRCDRQIVVGVRSRRGAS
jgi:hypothetical protein